MPAWATRSAASRSATCPSRHSTSSICSVFSRAPSSFRSVRISSWATRGSTIHARAPLTGRGPISRNRIFFFGNIEALREKSETPSTRDVPSASYRDGVIVYRCQVAAECPGGSVQGLTGSYSVPSGFQGIGPAQIRALDPLGIGPSAAVSQYMKQYPLPNDPGIDGVNLMRFRFAAPIQNDFKTYVFRSDAKVTESGGQNL